MKENELKSCFIISSARDFHSEENLIGKLGEKKHGICRSNLSRSLPAGGKFETRTLWVGEAKLGSPTAFFLLSLLFLRNGYVMASSAISAHICPEVYNPQGLNGVQGTNGVYNGANDKTAIATFLKVSSSLFLWRIVHRDHSCYGEIRQDCANWEI